jgi:hypothetical protein
MKLLSPILPTRSLSIALLCLTLTTASTQTQRPRPATPDSQANKADTWEYIRAKLLSLGPVNSEYGYASFSFDQSSCTMAGTHADNTSFLIWFANLDANGTSWDLKSSNGETMLGITIVSKEGKDAELVGATQFPISHLSFSLTKAAAEPGFQPKITSAFKHLITLCGGVPESTQF